MCIFRGRKLFAAQSNSNTHTHPTQRASLEVEAFNAVEGGGRVNAYRRNSIINRLPPDIALSLHEREEERRSSMSERAGSIGGYESGEGETRTWAS